MYLEINGQITAVPSDFMKATPYLTEVYPGTDVSLIESGAFSDCPLLSYVTFNGDTDIESGAFSGCGKNLTFILTGDYPAVEKYAADNHIKVVRVRYNSEKSTTIRIISISRDLFSRITIFGLMMTPLILKSPTTILF